MENVEVPTMSKESSEICEIESHPEMDVKQNKDAAVPPGIRRPSLRLEIPAKLEILELNSGQISAKIKSARSLPSHTPASARNGKKSVQFQTKPASSTHNQTTPRQFSLARLLTPRFGRTLSFPLRSELREGFALTSKEKQIKRSTSGPLDGEQKQKKLTRLSSGTYLVKSATPRPRDPENHELRDGMDNNNIAIAFQENVVVDDIDHSGEEIPEEDAVCRICLCELAEDVDGIKTMKLECSCKGELALAHEECALKWFGIRGNRECDVCGQVVENLPVTLVRLDQTAVNPQTQTMSLQEQQQQLELGRLNAMRRIWHDIPVLVMITMLTYFCLLEQLLVKRKGPRALLLALPFSVMFGMLTAISATTLVKRSFMWIFSFVQLGLVIMFGHIFYSWFRLIPVLSIALAGFAGFGLSMVLNALAMECWRFIRRRRARATTNASAENPSAVTTITDPQHRDIEQGSA